METVEFSNTIATLVTNGFHIHKVERLSPENVIINTHKYDRLGAEIRYSILFSEDKDETSTINSLITCSKGYNSNPLYINDHFSVNVCSSFSKQKFFNFFGGIVNTGLILIPNLPSILNELGHNKVPMALFGDPPDLHEIYVTECLQFILESPTRRYGQERLYESLPDGVVIGKNFMILLDSKAYSNGYSYEADDIKRFAFYVDDFNNRYSQYLGRVFTFLVISGNFSDSLKSIESRSIDLYKKCGCKLSCLKSEELGNFVQLLQESPEYRRSIDWKNIFSELMVETKLIKREMKRIQLDKIH